MQIIINDIVDLLEEISQKHKGVCAERTKLLGELCKVEKRIRDLERYNKSLKTKVNKYEALLKSLGMMEEYNV